MTSTDLMLYNGDIQMCCCCRWIRDRPCFSHPSRRIHRSFKERRQPSLRRRRYGRRLIQSVMKGTSSNSKKQYDAICIFRYTFILDLTTRYIVLQALLQIASHQVTKRFLTADHGKELFHKSGSSRMIALTGAKSPRSISGRMAGSHKSFSRYDRCLDDSSNHTWTLPVPNA